jgi:hypothetical protein
MKRQLTNLLPFRDVGQLSRDVGFSGVAAFTSRSDASWPSAGIIKGSVPIVDTILCHAPSVRRKAGSVKINLGDWRWQLAVGRGGYPWLKNVWFAWFVWFAVHSSIGARVS